MDKRQVLAVFLTLGIANIGMAVLLSETSLFIWFLTAGACFLMLSMVVLRIHSDSIFYATPTRGQKEQLLADFRMLVE
eukprot:3451606-Pleurochrysis_carterae.AAC.2